ncbi:MAG TPA: hypothetical protein VGF79_01770 [Bacteroidia bacterium]
MNLKWSLILVLAIGCKPSRNSEHLRLDLSNQSLLIIPDSVYSLRELESLQLGNEFTLYPPLSALANEQDSISNLNRITEISSEVAKLKRLRYLGTCNNDLKSIPKEIVELNQLDTLDLSFNKHLNIKASFETLKLMSGLKYLNIVETTVDSSTLSQLKKALPNTKIDANLMDIIN